LECAPEYYRILKGHFSTQVVSDFFLIQVLFYYAGGASHYVLLYLRFLSSFSLPNLQSRPVDSHQTLPQFSSDCMAQYRSELWAVIQRLKNLFLFQLYPAVAGLREISL